MKKIVLFVGLSVCSMITVQPMMRRTAFSRLAGAMAVHYAGHKVSDDKKVLPDPIQNQENKPVFTSQDIKRFYIAKKLGAVTLTPLESVDFVMSRRVLLNGEMVVLYVHNSVADQDLRDLFLALDGASPMIKDFKKNCQNVGATVFVLSGLIVIWVAGMNGSVLIVDLHNRLTNLHNPSKWEAIMSVQGMTYE